MQRGALSVEELSGGIDLGLTIESGQTYLWRREDGRTYEGGATPLAAETGDAPWYVTVVGVDENGTVAARDPADHAVVRVRQTDSRLEWESTHDAMPILRELLRLDDDLAAIEASAPEDPLVGEAFEVARGMRIVRDPPFPTTISFICSAQMRVSRIHDMVTTLAETYGETVEFDGQHYHAFPTPDRLAAATEDELRELGLGYRAPYVQRTAELVATGPDHPEDARGLPYEEARDFVTRFVGVGEKVADCVLLFSLGYLNAVPLDTWIRSAIEDHYPDCDGGNYARTSRAIRDRLGVRTGALAVDGGTPETAVPARTAAGNVRDREDAYAGYVQTYLFHYLRTR
ncbi:MAG TPA: DNA glycosylase [Natrialbaceae archaeon]|nr:DNA glycosylase [Natrialbaceae archaeon]